MKGYFKLPWTVFSFFMHDTFLLFCIVMLLSLAAMPVHTCSAGSDKETVVMFSDKSGKELCRFSAELAQTPEEQSRGLMFRKHLNARSGMLFINNEDAMRFFWMKNTYIPLDLVFISTGGEVKHVHYNAKPLDETPLSSVHPVRYVLEINAGTAKKCHIMTGTKTAIVKKK